MQRIDLDIKVNGSREDCSALIYLHEYSEELAVTVRPVIIICPGGGYGYTSDREADIIALKFMAMGYQAALVRYSCETVRYPVALEELGRAVSTIRKNSVEWHIDPEQVYILGFSAGGHLVANYASFWKEEWLAKDLEVRTEELAINGQILCYPVITSGEYAHEGSFRNLLGDAYDEKKESLSMELHVTDAVPRTFIWHTFEDGCVPVQNSLFYVNTLIEKKIPVEYHLFEKGGHGLSLGNRLSSNKGYQEVEPVVQPWIELVNTWIGRLD